MAGRDPFVFRSRMNPVIAVAVWLVVAVIAAEPALRLAAGDGAGALPVLGTLSIIAVAAGEAFWRPRLVIDDDGVELVNVLRTVRVPWTTVVDVRTRWALTIVTPHRSYSADGAPAPGAGAAARVRGDVFGRPGRRDLQSGLAASERPGTDSGDAAEIVRRHWDGLLSAGRIPVGRATDPVTTRWHVVPLVVLGALVVATATAIVV